MSVLPVRIAGDEGVAFENSVHDGVKREVLRSLCQLVNSSELALEVALKACSRPGANIAANTASAPSHGYHDVLTSYQLGKKAVSAF